MSARLLRGYPPPPGALNRGKYDAIYQLTPAFVEELRTFYGSRPS